MARPDYPVTCHRADVLYGDERKNMSLLAATIPVQAVSLLVGDNGVATHLGLFASELF